jgi:membrane-associated protease RseP (regulator of RpoE activity)
MAGPIAGLLASLTFFVVGLGLTASIMTMDNGQMQAAELPALPLYLLRSSTLGGDLIELALGKGTLMRELPSETVLPLHPFAVSGFLGILTNALALLPLGRK